MSRYHVKTMKRFLAAVLGFAVVASACGDPVPPTTPTPVTPTIPETFTGVVLPLGTSLNNFTVRQFGGLQVSLTNVSPSASVGLGVGTPSGANCVLIDSLTVVAGPTVQLNGTTTIPGTFCVSVFDPGNLVEAVNYTVVVLHS
jgi:hypothetical protein